MDSTPPLYVVAGPMDHPHDADTFAASMDTPVAGGATINAEMADGPWFPKFLSVYDLIAADTPISVTIAPQPCPPGMPTVQIGGATYPDLMDPAFPAAFVAGVAAFFTRADAQGITSIGAFRLVLLAEQDGQGQWGGAKGIWPGAHFTADGTIAATAAVVQGLAAIQAVAACDLWVSFFDPGEWLDMAEATLTAVKANWPGRVFYVGTVFEGGPLSRADLALMPLVDGGGIQLSTGLGADRVPDVYDAAVALVPAMQVIECHHGQPEAIAGTAS